MLRRFPARQPGQIEDARAAGAEVSNRWPGAGVFLSGSPFAGLGTPMSDVDVFVVTDERTATEQLSIQDVRVDVEYVRPDALAQLVERCERFAVTDDDVSQLAYAQYSALDRLIRLALAEIVADPGGTLKGLQERIHAAAGDVCKLLVARLAVQSANHVEDAWGSMEAGDPPAAQYSARMGLLYAAEALLASRGDAYCGVKWVWGRWSRTVGTDLGTRVRDAIHAPDTGVEVALALTQDLFIQAMVGDTYDIVCDADATQPRRHLDVRPMLVQGAVLLGRSDTRSVRVSPQGALLWGVAHGRPRQEAAGIVAAKLGLRTAEVDAYYQRLIDTKVLTDAEVSPADAVGIARARN